MCGRSVKNMERKIKDKEKQERQFKSKKKKKTYASTIQERHKKKVMRKKCMRTI